MIAFWRTAGAPYRPAGGWVSRRESTVASLQRASKRTRTSSPADAPGAKHGAPANLAALQQHRCSSFRHSETGRLLPWELAVDGELRRFDVAASFFTNDPESEVAAIVAGMGIGLLDSINAAADIRAGRLVPLLTAHHSDNLAFWLYYAQRNPMPRRVRAFIDFVLEKLTNASAFRLSAEELKKFASQRRRSCSAPA